jgi:ureidoglycolate hydrolase
MSNESPANPQESNPIILTPEAITKENFAQFGELILPIGNRESPVETPKPLIFLGEPLFKTFVLDCKPMIVSQMTRHSMVTQCLNSTDFRSWHIAVCPADADSPTPTASEAKVFIVPPNAIIRLDIGTWHEGPFPFCDNSVFGNLQCIDTEDNDYDTQKFSDNSTIFIDNGFTLDNQNEHKR